MIPRYTDLPFPGYAYVPGKQPHPTRDPAGHSYNQLLDSLASFDSNSWQDCEPWLYGVDLFNYRYWWEAHESFETVWVAAGRQTITGYFIQGIIQIAVAHLKNHQDFHAVARRMADAGLEKMHGVHGVFLGINTDQFRQDTKNYFHNESDQPVVIELSFLEK